LTSAVWSARNEDCSEKVSRTVSGILTPAAVSSALRREVDLGVLLGGRHLGEDRLVLRLGGQVLVQVQHGGVRVDRLGELVDELLSRHALEERLPHAEVGEQPGLRRSPCRCG